MPDISRRLDKAEKYLQKGKPEAALEKYLEALEAFQAALHGFEKLRQEKHALAAAKAMVELSPTSANLQRAGEKAAAPGEGKTAAANFVRLGLLQEESSPGAGFEWFAQAYNQDSSNLEAVFAFARGLFSRNAVEECIAVLDNPVTNPESTSELRELYARALMAAR